MDHQKNKKNTQTHSIHFYLVYDLELMPKWRKKT